MYYRLGSIETNIKGEHTVNVVRDFTQVEFSTYKEHGRFLGLHLKNKHLYKLIVRNGEELEKYLSEIIAKKMSEKDNSADIIFESNRLLMNYLSMLKTYDDHISHSLSGIFGPEVKEDFKSYLSVLYDEFFTYRFIVRLRNLAQHFEIPITNYTMNEEGNFVLMKKDDLLKYSGWSKVRKEIEGMSEEILVQGLAKEMNQIMQLAYFFVMQQYASNIIEAIKWISTLQQEFSGKATMIVSANSRDEFKAGNINFIPMNSNSFIDAANDLNDLPNVNIKIK